MSELQNELLNLIANMSLKSGRNDTFADHLKDSSKNIRDAAKTSVAMNDAYGNSLLAIGDKDKVAEFQTLSLDNDSLNWGLWLALYNDSWIFRRAIDKPSQDEIRTGVTFVGDADFSNVERNLNKYKFEFTQLLQWGALFGGSIACLMFDNLSDEDYKQPKNIKKLKQSKTMRMYISDRWYGVSPSTETVTDMQSLDFGKPKYYDVTLADGHTVKFHHDYVLRYEHRTAPKLIKNGMLQGWGYAEGAHIVNELSRDEKLKASIQSLVDKSLIEIIKMSGMRGVFMGADADNEVQLRKRLEMVNWGRNYNSLTFLDKDDEYEAHEFSGLNGLSDVLEKNMWQISAALEMQGVLYGDLKQGFSNDVDALQRYDETIHNRCDSYLRPVYEKFFKLMYDIFEIDLPVEFEFNTLLVKEHEAEKLISTGTVVDLCGKLLNDGIINSSKYAEIIQHYLQSGKLSVLFTDAELKELDTNFELESEGSTTE